MDVTFFESQPYFLIQPATTYGETHDKVVSCEDKNEEEIWVPSNMIQPKVQEAKLILADGKLKSKKKKDY